jgi:hypothetical protein
LFVPVVWLAPDVEVVIVGVVVDPLFPVIWFIGPAFVSVSAEFVEPLPPPSEELFGTGYPPVDVDICPSPHPIVRTTAEQTAISVFEKRVM